MTIGSRKFRWLVFGLVIAAGFGLPAVAYDDYIMGMTGFTGQTDAQALYLYSKTVVSYDICMDFYPSVQIAVFDNNVQVSGQQMDYPAGCAAEIDTTIPVTLGDIYAVTADHFIYPYSNWAGYDWNYVDPSTGYGSMPFGSNPGGTYYMAADPYYLYLVGEAIYIGTTEVAIAPAVPSISSISPPSGTVGTSGTISVNGDNLIDPFWSTFEAYADAVIPLVSGSGVTVSVGDPTSYPLILNYSIASDAAVGNRSLTLKHRFGTSNAVTFTVRPPPQITSVSPSTILINGPDVSVTISGSGFGTAPVLNLPPGVIASGQNSSDTQITVTLGADGDTAAVGNSSISVTANGATSNNQQLVLDGPYSIAVITDNSGPCSGCTTTIYRLINYQVKNFSGSNTGPVTICEEPSASAWSCAQSNPPLSANFCGSDPGESYSGTFTDKWTLGPGNWTPIGCGRPSVIDPWFWSTPTPTPIGTPSGSIFTNAITIQGVTTPNQLSAGTIISK
jgi:hypothetical protein